MFNEYGQYQCTSHLRMKYLLAAKTITHPMAIPNTKPMGENPFSSLELSVGDCILSETSDLDGEIWYRTFKS